MKKLALTGVLSALAVLILVSIMTPARTANDGMPVGTVLAWAGDAKSLPAGWMLCNGKAMNRVAYKDLFAVIGTRWGGSGSAFNLPDLRGRFLRGDDAGTGRDPDAKKRTPSMPGGSATGVGSVQEDALQNHKHAQGSHYHQYNNRNGGILIDMGSGASVAYSSQNHQNSSSEIADIRGAASYGTKSQIKCGEETRPKNAAVIFIIKVK